MATRRKYKSEAAATSAPSSPPGSADAPPPAASPPAAAIADAGSNLPEPPPPSDELKRLLEAQRNAETLQRQQAATIERQIDSLPISAHKKDFLRKFPQMLEAGNARAMGQAYQRALAAGVPDDSWEMDSAIIREFQRSQAERPAAAGPNGAIEPPRDKFVDQVSASVPMTPLHDLPVIPPVPPMPPGPRGRSLPVGAPVSREVPMSSGERAGPRSVTLSPEEREVARNSFTDLRMTNAEKERLYAQNKAKMLRMRADRTLNE